MLWHTGETTMFLSKNGPSREKDSINDLHNIRNSELLLFAFLLFVLNVLNLIVLMGYSNPKSVSTYAFVGIPTNNLYSFHGGSIYQSDAVSARYEEKRSAVHRWRGKVTEEGGRPEPMPRVGAFDLPE